MPTYSFVIPVHNEQEVLDELFDELDELAERLDGPCEFVLVDDGSTDASWSMMAAHEHVDPRYRSVRLSRNFGHQIAVTAGVDHAVGRAVVIMDADLQDPPSVVVEMARRWREGYDVVYGIRLDRDEDTRFKRWTASAFYRVLNRLSSVDIPQQVGDFRLIDRAVVDALGRMPERNRYVRGMFAWLGFRQIGVPYRRPARRAGTTSYTLKRMLGLASDGMIGYSKLPLRATLGLGAVAVSVGVAGAIGDGVVRGTTGHRVAALGWCRSAVFGGVQLLAVGVLGEYVSRIFDESLGRPLYVVRDDPRGVGWDGRESLPSGQLHDLFPAPREAVAFEARAASPGQ